MSKLSRFFGGAVAVALAACALLAITAAQAWAAEPGEIYAMYYRNGQTVTCEDGSELGGYTLVLQGDDVPDSDHGYGEYDESQGGLVAKKIEEENGPTRRGWASEVDAQVTKVIVRDLVRPEDTYGWFEGMKNCVSMDLANLDTQNVTDMSSMFSGCTAVEALPVGHFATSNVVDAGFMFAHCESLKSLDVSSWNTSKLENASDMFWVCGALKNLDVSLWQTSNLRFAPGMFSCCYSLEAIDVSQWDMRNLEQSLLMFKECHSVKELDLSRWSTPKLTKAWEMFGQCYSLFNLNCKGWRAPNLENVGGLFIESSALRSLDLSTLTMGNATNLSAMFYGCSALETLDLSGWDTSKAVTNNGIANIMGKCRSLSLIKLGAKTQLGSELPTPNAEYIPNATGRWVNAAGRAFAARDIPVGTAATYAAEGSAAAAALVKKPTPSLSPSSQKISLANAVVSVGSRTWTGKSQKCAVPVVKVGGKTLRYKTDFTYSCKAGKSVGSYKVTVTGKGAYAGTKTATFKIVPKATGVSKLTRAKKAFTVKWKKPSKAALKQTTGYQVRWSTAKSMKGAKSKTVKAASSAGKKCALKVAKLKAGKKYYVQVRTYKKVGKATYYSSWSKAKAVTTKK